MPKGINNATGRSSQYKHGLSSKPWSQLYRCWVQMRNRCNNPNKPDYPYYGGRGIKVCKRWSDYVTFATDMGEPPTPKHTIERKNSNGNYSPRNCCWATRKEQAMNRDYCKLREKDLTRIKELYFLRKMTQVELAEMFDVTQSHISQVVRS